MPARKRVTKPAQARVTKPVATAGGVVYEVQRAFAVLCTDGKVRHVKRSHSAQLPALLTADQLDTYTEAGLLSRRAVAPAHPAVHATEGHVHGE
jgi:hypothetical protein